MEIAGRRQVCCCGVRKFHVDELQFVYLYTYTQLSVQLRAVKALAEAVRLQKFGNDIIPGTGAKACLRIACWWVEVIAFASVRRQAAQKNARSARSS